MMVLRQQYFIARSVIPVVSVKQLSLNVPEMRNAWGMANWIMFA